jgi:hypothetical protein
VVSIGYPASVDSVTDPNLTPSFKDGSISSVKTVQGGVLPVYEISAAVSGGMSGGPSVNLDGEVIGVNSFGILGEPQAFNFLRPSSQLAELMAGAGVQNELSDTTQAYREGLLAYWDGDKATAVDKLGSVVDEQPSNKLAADFLAKAKDLPEPPAKKSDSGGLPIVPIVIGVAALVVIGGGLLAFLLLRRKGGSAPAAPAMTGMPVAPVAPAVPAAPVAAPASAAPAPAPAPAAPAPAAPVTPAAPPYGSPLTAETTPAAPAAPLGFSGPSTTPPQAPAPTPAAPTPAPTPAPTASAAPPPAPAPAPAPAAAPAPAPAPEPTPTPAPVAEHEPHSCSNCGEHVEHGKKFCSNCGTPLS